MVHVSFGTCAHATTYTCARDRGCVQCMVGRAATVSLPGGKRENVCVAGERATEGDARLQARCVLTWQLPTSVVSKPVATYSNHGERWRCAGGRGAVRGHDVPHGGRPGHGRGRRLGRRQQQLRVLADAAACALQLRSSGSSTPT
jgi:hypothetical protein